MRPVTVVTSLVDGQPCGTTVSSFASLSLDPPLISVAFDHRSAMLANIEVRPVRVYWLTGPELVTYADIAAVLGAAARPDHHLP